MNLLNQKFQEIIQNSPKEIHQFMIEMSDTELIEFSYFLEEKFTISKFYGDIDEECIKHIRKTYGKCAQEAHRRKIIRRKTPEEIQASIHKNNSSFSQTHEKDRNWQHY